VLALDGLDPQTIDLLLSEGKLPTFAKLRTGGAYGRLTSAKPLLSPVVWTTVATGKTPDHHGIGHFLAVNEQTGEQLPVTSTMRRVKAVWNILSDANRSVSVVGWWATWPPEHVRGVMVSDHLAYHFLHQSGVSNPAEADTVFPREAATRFASCATQPEALPPAAVAPYLDVSPQDVSRPFDFDDPVSHFKWALSAAETYRCVGLELWKGDRPSALMVYIEAVDSVSHLFGHLFRAQGLEGELRAQQARYGRAVEAMYAYIDRVVGDYVAAMDRDTTLVVLSDHGFELGALQADPSKTRDMRRVSEEYHRMDGILYLYGRGVNSRSRLQDATILDVAPTLLALQNVPPARDMPGRVLSEALTVEQPARVATYETAAPGSSATASRDARVDRETLERLRSLGYITASSPSGDRNLAGIHFEAGRYEEAARAYEALIRSNPRDGGLRASLAGTLGALGRYDAALEQLSMAIKLDPLNVEAYHNRAVIHERTGDVAAAVADYENALRYNPKYEPSRKALSRLGVKGDLNTPRTDAEARALQLATEASEAARRASYADAMRKLDAAVAIAPDYALLYQYRSNVAYLMGDIPSAVAALKKGLEIDPGNALFRENLERLQQQPTAPR
jgi:tetratricopeptide (TPR) repeat protein